MPLVSGESREAIGKNISILRQEGKPPKQAIAIALRMAGKAKTAAVDPEIVERFATCITKQAMWDVFKAALVSPEAGTAAAQAFAKTAAPWQSALGGAAIGGLGGAALGGLGAHLRGEDVGQGAMRGGFGGAALGAGAGALKGILPQMNPGQMGSMLAEKGLSAAMLGGGTMAGGALASAAFGSPLASEQEAKEVGKFEAQRKIDAQRREALRPHQEMAFSRAMQDDTIARAPADMIQSAFDTMRSFAPTLAADPNATLSFLRESAVYGTGPSYASIKNLADSEKSVMGAAKMAGAK